MEMFAKRSGHNDNVRLWVMKTPGHIKEAWRQEFLPIVVTISDFTSGYFNKFMLEFVHVIQTADLIWQSIVNMSQIKQGPAC